MKRQTVAQPAASPNKVMLLLQTRALWLALILIALAATYANALHSPFHYQDLPSILHNSSIQSVTTLLDNPHNRSHLLVAFSFALNACTTGFDSTLPWHLINLLIHLAAAFLLFNILQRSFASLHNQLAQHATTLAGCSALLWAVHPLLTESVTYISGRAESLMALLFLASFAAFIRATASVRPLLWLAASVLACALGMGTTPTILAAPFVVLLYDRCFISSSIRSALTRRWKYYLALFATGAIFLAATLAQPTSPPSESAVAPTQVTTTQVFATQPQIVLHQLANYFWPENLCIDYAWPPVASLSAAWPSLSAALLFTLMCIFLLWKSPRLGFLPASLLLMAVTGAFRPADSLAAENHMYLPLASVTCFFVILLWKSAQLAAQNHQTASPLLLAAVTLALSAPLAMRTAHRNRDYASPVSLWASAVKVRPNNPRAHVHLADAYAAAAQPERALKHYRAALDIPIEQSVLPSREQTYALANFNYGLILLQAADPRAPTSAIEHFNQAARLGLRDRTGYNLAMARAYLRMNAPQVANEYIERAVASGVAADSASDLAEIGRYLLDLNQHERASEILQRALELDPDSAEIRTNFASTLARAQRTDDAIAQLREALTHDNAYVPALINLGMLLNGRRQFASAIDPLQKAIELDPKSTTAHLAIAESFKNIGNVDAAEDAFRKTIQLNPTLGQAHRQYANLLVSLERFSEAERELKAALSLDNKDAHAHNDLGWLYERLQRFDEAIQQYEAAVAISPNILPARSHLERLRNARSEIP